MHPQLPTYFANRKSKPLLEALNAKVDDYYHYLRLSGTLALWRRCHQQFYAGYYHSGRVHSLPPKGQLKKIITNDFRNIVENLHILITKVPPRLKAIATNSHTSTSELIPAGTLLEYYQQQMNMDNVVSTAKIYDILYGMGGVMAKWDFYTGESYAHFSKQCIKTGDLSYVAVHPIDMIQDLAHKQESNSNDIHSWIIIRDYVNRYELAKDFPKHQASIMAMPPPSSYSLAPQIDTYPPKANEDTILVYRFYHKRTAAVPEGKEIVFTRDKVLLNSTLRYQHIPIVKCCSNYIDNAPIGYSITFDMLPIQEARDKLISTILTNQSIFGLQMILNPRGSNIQYKNLNGLSIIDYDREPDGNVPRSLDLLNTSPEIFNFVTMLGGYMEKISGVNAILRGMPPSKTMSGKAMSLISSMAVQYVSNYEKNYAYTYRQLGKITFDVLKNNLSIQKQYHILGDDGRMFSSHLNASDISTEYSIQVELSNPLTRTTQGRLGLADILLEHGVQLRPEQIMSLINTGQFKREIYGKLSEEEAIKNENKALVIGKEVVQVLKIDDHPKHIRSHRDILNTNAMRANPRVIERVYKHIKEHLNAWEYVSKREPVLLEIYGIPLYKPNNDFEPKQAFAELPKISK